MKLKDVKEKAKLSNWYQSAPEWLQNLGDALQGMALFILGYVSLDETGGLKWLAISALLIGGIGIFSQKLFKK